jgi:general secretion pathway protein M
MQLDALPKPMRRIVALVLVVLAVGLAVLLAIAPFVRLAALGEERAAARDLIAQQERLALAAAGRPTQAGRDVLVAGDSSGTAGAELQRVISEIARQHALSLRSTQVAPPKREADLTMLAVDVSLQGGMEGLRALLHAVETGAPMLFIDGLAVKTLQQQQPATDRPVQLDISLKVRGYGAGKDAN